MPELTQAELLMAYRKSYPELAKASDRELLDAIHASLPELSAAATQGTKNANFADDQTPGGVAWEGIKNAAMGLPRMLMGIPKAHWDVLTAKKFTDPIVGTAKGAATPFIAAGKNIRALVDESAAPASREENRAGQEFAGTILMGEGLKAGGNFAKAKALKMLPDERVLQQWATDRKAEAIGAAKPEHRAELESGLAEKAAKERRGQGWTGRKIDLNLQRELEGSKKRLGAATERFLGDPRPEAQIRSGGLLEAAKAQRAGGQVPGTEIEDPARGSHWDTLQEQFFKPLPDYASREQIIKVRQILDDIADSNSGFNALADRPKGEIYAKGGDIARESLNVQDPAFKKANADYSTSRRLADIAGYRKTVGYGKPGKRLPNEGGSLDDRLVMGVGGTLGYGLGGPAGAVGGAGLAEALNLGRQTRGFANLKSGLWQALADAKGFGNAQPPLKMLGAGKPVGPSETSGVRGENAFPGWGPPNPLHGGSGPSVPAGKPIIEMVKDPVYGNYIPVEIDPITRKPK